jgi:hypothetical protein
LDVVDLLEVDGHGVVLLLGREDDDSVLGVTVLGTVHVKNGFLNSFTILELHVDAVFVGNGTKLLYQHSTEARVECDQ